MAGVVLAAGPSTRFGGGVKQLYELDGETLVHRTARRALASRLATVVVVTGFEAERVRAAVADLPVATVENRDYRSGQASSVRAGLAAVADATAAMFLPVDQPFLDVAVVDRLVEAYAETGGPIVVPTHAGRRGAPALIDRSLFPELAEIGGDAGGRQIFARHANGVVEVPLVDGRALIDVDTPDALRSLIGSQPPEEVIG